MTGIAAEFPEVPHRYCDNHFLRDAAKPVLDADSHAKVQMRKKVRGLRGIEQSVLKQRRQRTQRVIASTAGIRSVVIEAANADNAPLAEEDPAGRCDPGATVLWFEASSTTIRVGRFDPPGLRMAALWTRFGTRSSETWTRKKGFPRGATQPLGRLHRQGFGLGTCARMPTSSHEPAQDHEKSPIQVQTTQIAGRVRTPIPGLFEPSLKSLKYLES